MMDLRQSENPLNSSDKSTTLKRKMREDFENPLHVDSVSNFIQFLGGHRKHEINLYNTISTNNRMIRITVNNNIAGKKHM